MGPRKGSRREKSSSGFHGEFALCYFDSRDLGWADYLGSTFDHSLSRPPLFLIVVFFVHTAHTHDPRDLIIKPKNYHVNRWWNCEGERSHYICDVTRLSYSCSLSRSTDAKNIDFIIKKTSRSAIHELYRQFILGDESKYAPYVNYLKNQPRGRIPDEWTDAGKQLLHTILDSRENDDEGLQPPTEKSYEETWIGECKGEDTPLARAAFYQFTSRDEDTLMVPFFDMSNHSNDPEKLNTAYPQRPKRPGQPFVLRSMRDIRPGEQVHISYNRCHRCWFDESYEDCELYSNYETNDVFHSFGFVEEFPQTWKFKMNVGDEEHPSWDLLKFCLTRDDSSSSGLVVRFGDNYTPDPESEIPTMGNVVYLGKQLMRLVELEATVKNDDKVMETMPKYEWEMAWTYHQALMTSISAALLASDIVNPAGSDDDSEESDYSEDNSEDWDEKDIDYDSGDEPDDEDERDEL